MQTQTIDELPMAEEIDDGAVVEVRAHEPPPFAREQYVFLALPERPQEKPVTEEKSIVKPYGRGRCKAARSSSSLLPRNFNRLWSHCRNLKTEPWTHFAMLHDDVVPRPLWVDALIDEMDRLDADVISAVIPIKDDRGLTSTGLRDSSTGDVRRLTMHEVMRLPITFGLEECIEAGICSRQQDLTLVVNTGMWVCRWDKWVHRMPGFRFVDAIVDNPDGTCKPVGLSEDWWFSDWATRQGLKLRATRLVPAMHLICPGASKGYTNQIAWGTCEVDPGE